MNNALLISLIGGGMIFIGLILLWLMMALLVRLTNGKSLSRADESASGMADLPESESSTSRKVAAAAVAAALALQKASTINASSSKSAGPSLWLSLGRSRQIEASNALLRKKKGTL